MTTVMHNKNRSRSNYSFTRYLFSVIWIFSAFLIAQLADGYQFNAVQGFLFSALLGIFAGRIKSTFLLGAYVGFSILLAHFLIATYSMKYSADQFFPSFWGPLDLLLMLMMWTSPLIVLIAEFFDTRIASAFEALLFTALYIFKSEFTKFWLIGTSQIETSVGHWFDQWTSTKNASRAPPFVC